MFFSVGTSTRTTTTRFMSGSYAAGADADAGGGGADEDEDGYDDKHHDGGVKLARSNTVNKNNDGTAMDKEGGPDAKNVIRLRGIVTFSFPLIPLPQFFSCVCVHVVPISRLRL